MEKIVVRYSGREFLNKPGYNAGAFVRAEVFREYMELVRGDRKGEILESSHADVEIADCYKRIGLVFDFETHENRVNSVHKIDVLITVLTEFREALVQEFDYISKKKAEKGE